MNKDLFSHRVIAELLPPLGPNFKSALWDAVGRKFTGLEYYEADMISRRNKEFISTLFPSQDIYVSLLPSCAQEVIGKIGKNSQGAAHLLSSIGFQYNQHVDPFDGGPHFEAARDNIKLIKEALNARLVSAEKIDSDSQSYRGLIGCFKPQNKAGKRFLSVMADYLYSSKSKKIALHPKSIERLDIDINDEVIIIDSKLCNI
ncbi:MAG: arginine N-succinyltransferase, partial [Myxococcales bacterium]|nr:arginine N-succinyltransferase [Myxococcales bacterium]